MHGSSTRGFIPSTSWFKTHTQNTIRNITLWWYMLRVCWFPNRRPAWGRWEQYERRIPTTWIDVVLVVDLCTNGLWHTQTYVWAVCYHHSISVCRAIMAVLQTIRLVVTYLIGLFWLSLVSLQVIRLAVTKRGKFFGKKNRTVPPKCMEDPALGVHYTVQLKVIKVTYHIKTVK